MQVPCRPLVPGDGDGESRRLLHGTKATAGEKPAELGDRKPVSDTSPANLEREPVPPSLVSARLIAASESRCSKLLKSPLPVDVGWKTSHHFPRGRVTSSHAAGLLTGLGKLSAAEPQPGACCLGRASSPGDRGPCQEPVAPDQRPQPSGAPAWQLLPPFLRKPAGGSQPGTRSNCTWVSRQPHARSQPGPRAGSRRRAGKGQTWHESGAGEAECS